MRMRIGATRSMLRVSIWRSVGIGFFKYANFVSENLAYLFERPFWHFNITLPLGMDHHS
jgi:hypothetical protein